MEVHLWDYSLCLIGGISLATVAICLLVYFCVEKILEHKKNIVEMKLSHEKNMKEKEWERKKEWEELIKDTPSPNAEPVAEGNEEELKKKIKDLEEQLKKATQLDLERMALLVHFSTNKTEPWTKEKADQVIEQVKNTQEAIKKYLDFKP